MALPNISSSKSFFRLDPEYAPRNYDTNNKITLPDSQVDNENNLSNSSCIASSTASIPLSNETPSDSIDFAIEESSQVSNEKTCGFCNKTFKSIGGTKNHMNKCKLRTTSEYRSKISTNISNDKLTSENIAVPQCNIHLTSSNTDLTSSDSPAICGNLSIETLTNNVNNLYDEVVHWRRNIFKLPSGGQGKAFIVEMSRLTDSWTNGSLTYNEI